MRVKGGEAKSLRPSILPSFNLGLCHANIAVMILLKSIFLLLLTFQGPAARADQPLPPKVIYQVGQKSFLQQDSAAGTVPQDAWDQYIMGSDTRYGLVPWRRGLYGGANFDGLELYGNLYFGKPKTPWVMKITIKDECRTAEASTHIRTDPRYANWVIAHVNEILKSNSECLNRNATTCSDLLIGFNAIAYGKAEESCDALQSRYLSDVNARAVKDGMWPDSWYLRDRSCIENIEASPSAVLSVLAHSKWDFKSRVQSYSGSPGAYGGTAFALLFGALADEPNANSSDLKLISETAASSDIRVSFSVDTPEERKLWIRELVPVLVATYESCRNKSNLSSFQNIAKHFEMAVEEQKATEGTSFVKIAEAAVAELKKSCNR